MKIFIFTIMLAALTAGLAKAGGGYGYQTCANSNSKACRDARDAFANHHGGAYPQQFRENHAYNNNNRGYWNERDQERSHEERHEQHREHHDRHDHE